MIRKVILPTILACFVTVTVQAQSQPARGESVPIYRVTVVERTVKAVDYQYRNGPTRVDFRGTVLLPRAKGEATVESKKGRTEIDVKFDRVEAPTRFGPEYLTYVLWAITPEGHPKNLGEVLPGSSDNASLHVTTDLQSFGMIVTAEPYSAVRQPSDVVIMENEVRPDTVGHIELVQAKYELMPRGQYTYLKPVDLQRVNENGPKLSMDEYEKLLEVYQAQNAVQIARSVGADRYAADTFTKAEELLRTAKDLQARKVDRSTVVTTARQAAQTAEDARTIAMQRKQSEQLAQAQEQARTEQELRARAELQAQQARSQASADRMQLEQERAARVQAETTAALAARTAAPAPAVVVEQPVGATSAGEKTDMRLRLLQELNRVLATRDTPRGLVVTVPETDFQSTSLNPAVTTRLTRLASVLAEHPGLFVTVEGNCDVAQGERMAHDRTMAVREALVRSGVPADSIGARSLGVSRPIASNATASGRMQNRRVEITISGDPIGSVAYWDKTYSLVPRQ
jgi:outer membrane protein OmpA-like peptidoglycan-associated protein